MKLYLSRQFEAWKLSCPDCHNSLLVLSIPIGCGASASRVLLRAQMMALRKTHTEKKRCSVTKQLEQNSADKIFNSLELSDLTSLEMAISISWLKY